MAGDHGASLPVAAMGVLAILFSTALLSQHAFDLLRLGEGESAQERSLQPPPVEARLWEDPLAAIVRHKDVARKQCTAEPRPTQCDSKYGEPLRNSDILVIVPMPGSSFVGGEEQRRRIRYAVLAGLASKGFVPEHSARLGLKRVPWCQQPSLAECEPATGLTLDVAYEHLKTERGVQERKATVLWLDDTKLGQTWLSAIAVLVDKLRDHKDKKIPKVTIIGPYTSERLVEAIRDLAEMGIDPPAGSTESADHCQNWRRLKSFDLVSPFSTADEGNLLKSADSLKIKTIACGGADRRNNASPQFKTLDEAFGELGLDPRASREPFFLRTVGIDTAQVEVLKSELCARGLGEGGRVALVHEWDSFFARSLVEKIRLGWQCPSGGKVTVDIRAYFGGLDGATLEGASKQQRLVPRAKGSDKDSSKEPEIEWPENRDQRDYIRRLVRSLQAGEDQDTALPVKAIGVFGQDVHDKLLLIQALRPVFTEQTIFTTDMDARLFHPEVARYMRNVVVSSALPLSPSDLRISVAPSPKFSPFRDSYQTATYLAAHYAAMDAPESMEGRKARADFRTELAKQLKTTHLHEVGRQGVIGLATPDRTPPEVWDRQIKARQNFALFLSALLALFGLVALVFMPSPALRQVVRRKNPCSLSTMFIAGTVIASWSFAVGVVVELAQPGRIGIWGVLGISALATAAFWIVFWSRPPAHAGAVRVAQPYRLRLSLVLLLPAGMACLLAFVSHRDPAAIFEPFTVFAGVSSWPSELLRALAVLLFGWFLDRTWRGTSTATAKVGKRYFPDEQSGEVDTLPFWKRLQNNAKIWIGSKAMLAGQNVASPSNDGGVDGSQVWRNYLMLLADGPRFLRLGLWLAVTYIVIFTIMNLAGGEAPDIPARGESDRSLFWLTIWLSVMATIILMILVSDATILTWRFVQALRDKRTVYPALTVRRFAAELGPSLADRASRAIPARPRERNDASLPARNSILDPWIDANLLADHTEGISKLIFFPLILLGLLFVARLQIFDNWSPNNVVMIVLVGFLLWMIGVATALNIGAEMARRRALEFMQMDLLWLKGSSSPEDKALAEQFPSLIAQVKELRRGAFAPFLEQPLVRAVLVPLGGIGGLQLIDLLPLVRP